MVHITTIQKLTVRLGIICWLWIAGWSRKGSFYLWLRTWRIMGYMIILLRRRRSRRRLIRFIPWGNDSQVSRRRSIHQGGLSIGSWSTWCLVSCLRSLIMSSRSQLRSRSGWTITFIIIVRWRHFWLFLRTLRLIMASIPRIRAPRSFSWRS